MKKYVGFFIVLQMIVGILLVIPLMSILFKLGWFSEPELFIFFAICVTLYLFNWGLKKKYSEEFLSKSVFYQRYAWLPLVAASLFLIIWVIRNRF